MNKVCAYCGREENLMYDLHIEKCPVCSTLACGLCMAYVKFQKVLGEGEPAVVHYYEGAVCKVHLPWNIIAGLERRAEENAR